MRRLRRRRRGGGSCSCRGRALRLSLARIERSEAGKRAGRLVDRGAEDGEAREADAEPSERRRELGGVGGTLGRLCRSLGRLREHVELAGELAAEALEVAPGAEGPDDDRARRAENGER